MYRAKGLIGSFSSFFITPLTEALTDTTGARPMVRTKSNTRQCYTRTACGVRKPAARVVLQRIKGDAATIEKYLQNYSLGGRRIRYNARKKA